jgi:hypothetical protein
LINSKKLAIERQNLFIERAKLFHQATEHASPSNAYKDAARLTPDARKTGRVKALIESSGH